MAKTLLDLEENLLAEAAVALGTTTKRETVTVALQRIVDQAHERRAEGFKVLLDVAESGGFHFDRLDDLDT